MPKLCKTMGSLAAILAAIHSQDLPITHPSTPPPPAASSPLLRPPDIPIIPEPNRAGRARPSVRQAARPAVSGQSPQCRAGTGGPVRHPPVPARPVLGEEGGRNRRNRSVDTARPENPRKLVWCAQGGKRERPLSTSSLS
jgi:hypothetical protein